ncbi:MAG: hypothetical protein ACO3JF_08315 [Ilumatobacteraceae bacterium]
MSYLSPPEVVAQSYGELRRRTIEILRSMPAEMAEIRVPHCPEWTVRETVCHMVGVPEDVLSGNMEGVTTEAWTQAQVDRHAGDSLSTLLDIWESFGDTIDSLIPQFPEPINSQFVFDSNSHEQDIRFAIGASGARNALSVHVSANWVRNFLEHHPHPQARELLAADVSDFDLFRSMGGRRSLAQIRASGLNEHVVAEIVAGMPVSIPAVDLAE